MNQVDQYAEEIKKYKAYVKIHTIKKDNEKISELRKTIKDYEYDPKRPDKMRVTIDQVRKIYFSILK